MSELTAAELDELSRKLAARKQVMQEEIRAGLAGLQEETIDDILAGTTDAGDISTANQLTEISTAEVARDSSELRDIVAAQARITAGTFGTCIDCGEPVPYARLAVYPTAKRCIRCQGIREHGRAAGVQR